jgi:hypothetical protein
MAISCELSCRLAGVKLGAMGAQLHGPALFQGWFVSDPRLIRPTD